MNKLWRIAGFVGRVLIGGLLAAQLALAQPADLMGEVSVEELMALPSFQAHDPGTTGAALSDDQRARLDGLELVVLLGSWCHDSQREVPRLLHLLQQAGVPFSLIAVSRDKQEPMVAVDRYQLQFTPTAVVFRGGEEIGRIVETPKHSWLEDLLQLAEKHNAPALRNNP